MTNPWQAGPNKWLILLGVFLLLAGVAIVVSYGLTHHLHCEQRLDGTLDCTAQVRWMGLILLRQEPLQGVTQSALGLVCGTVGKYSTYKCMYREVILYHGAGEYVIPSHYLNTQTTKETNAQIRAYLAAPFTEPLEIRNVNGFLRVMGMIFVAFPPLCLGGLFIWRQDLFRRHPY